ncbi:Putative protein of unknown function [Podospora comata]|uniref:Uncharacterized protein n=1 Tax=Podospora comata TaxID=48703 RepID=A0ABY6SCM7_PODCO|nr:Putative protein of unknown function [Podospora comata]
MDRPAGGISQRKKVATPVRGIDYKGFVEQEFHYLGDLATVGRSKQHRKAGRRWFDIYQEEDHPEIFNFEDSPMLPLEPFPLELVYRHNLEGVDLTAWEEEHNNTLPDLKPIYIDVNHHPLASEWSCFAKEEHIDKDHVPHIQLARYEHELFLESHVEDMENKPRLLTECWQKYLYWLRMSLMRVERLPAPGQILTTAEGFTVERDFLDTWAWGRGKSYEDVYQEVIDGNMFPQYWDRALYEVFTYWVQFKRLKAGYR